MSQIKFLSAVIIFSIITFQLQAKKQKNQLNFSYQNILNQNLNGSEELKNLAEKSGSMEKAFKQFKKTSGSVTHFYNEENQSHEFTFFYNLKDAKPQESLFLHLNAPENQVISMNRYEKSNIFYTIVSLKKLPDYISYSYRKRTGKFMQDPDNKLFDSDSRKSNIIRLSENSGAIVYAEDFYQKKYKKLPVRSNPIYLPAEYFTNPEKSFPVIYMLDGQNLWDNECCPYGGWKVNTIMEDLVKSNKIHSAIIAGISNSPYRTAEYAGWSKGVLVSEAPQEGFSEKDCQILSKEHAEMILKDFIPYVEKNFRVKTGKENRIIAGSSYGAYLSAWLMVSNPDVFSGAGLFSGGSHGYRQIMDQNLFGNNKFKIYLDCGTGDELEKILITETRNLHLYLIEKGYKEGSDLFYQEAAGAPHNEREWSKRVPDFLKFMLSAN